MTNYSSLWDAKHEARLFRLEEHLHETESQSFYFGFLLFEIGFCFFTTNFGCDKNLLKLVKDVFPFIQDSVGRDLIKIQLAYLPAIWHLSIGVIIKINIL